MLVECPIQGALGTFIVRKKWRTSMLPTAGATGTELNALFNCLSQFSLFRHLESLPDRWTLTERTIITAGIRRFRIQVLCRL
jgi:hypothetical protein